MNFKFNISESDCLVLDTSFLLENDVMSLKKFFITYSSQTVLPGAVIDEIKTGLTNEEKNINGYIKLHMLIDYNIQIIPSDNNFELDASWERNNDYYILTTCVKLKNEEKNVRLLTFDLKLLLKARGLGIKCDPLSKIRDDKKRFEKITNIQTYLQDMFRLEDTGEKKKVLINIQEKMKNKIKENEEILKFVITKDNKIKDIKYTKDYSYYEIDTDDELVIFTKVKCYLEMITLKNLNEKEVIKETRILQKHKNYTNERHKEVIYKALQLLLGMSYLVVIND